MSAALSQPAPMDLAGLHRLAQSRIQRHPSGIGFHGRYAPLADMVDQGERYGGRLRLDALTACQAVIDADDAVVTRMVQDRRASPVTATGAEIVAGRVASHNLMTGTVMAAAALATRPRVTLAEQIAAMQARGFGFAVHGHDLRVTPPPGGMTDGDRAFLRDSKAGVIEHVQATTEVF